jgi:hypothetical protein
MSWVKRPRKRITISTRNSDKEQLPLHQIPNEEARQQKKKKEKAKKLTCRPHPPPSAGRMGAAGYEKL